MKELLAKLRSRINNQYTSLLSYRVRILPTAAWWEPGLERTQQPLWCRHNLPRHPHFYLFWDYSGWKAELLGIYSGSTSDDGSFF